MKFIRKFLFHRAALILLAIILQLVAFIVAIIKFNDYFAFFYGGSLVLSMIAVFWVVNGKSNPVYKLAWVIPILIFPIFGGIFYFFLGRNILNERAKSRMKFISEKTKEVLEIEPALLNEMAINNETAANQSRYINNYSFYPPYNNTYTEYLPSGEKKFARLIEELKKAKHYIFLEYFIINNKGVMWNSILEILKEKAKAGVDVRIIYDDFGCLLTLPYRYDKKLEELGIKCSIFNPLIPILSPRLNNRDHRKIAIIDGYVGFTGGINLADEYINEYERFGHWKDTAIMLKGEAVWNLTVMFLSMWDFIRGINEDFNKFKLDLPQGSPEGKESFIQPFADSPLDDEPIGEIIYLNIINKAKRYVYITTPYLIIDSEMVTALTSAAKGGVDVRIITPHCADKWYVHTVSQSYYKSLIESGVKIYEYTPGFMHAKTYVADDEYGVVGTINMDYRSLYLHFECGVWMYGGNCVLTMKEDFLNTVKLCRQITMEELSNIPWYKRLAGSILRIFAPLM